MNPILTSALGSIIRYGLMIAAAFLVKKGIWTQSAMEGYVEAAVVGILTFSWTVWNHYKNRIKFLTALSMPAGSSEASVVAKLDSGVKPTNVVPLLVVTGLTIALLAGCSTLFTQIVTVTQIRDSAMKELAALHAQGKITRSTDEKIAQADAVYRKSAEVAASALKAYRDNPSAGTNYTAALQATKVAVSGILNILGQFIPASESAAYNTKLVKANQL